MMPGTGDQASFRALDLLLAEARDLNSDCKFAQALAAAGRAVALAEELDDPSWLLSALLVEEEALRGIGDLTGAIIRSTRILAMAGDPAVRHRLADPDDLWNIFRGYCNWLDSAAWLPDFPYAGQLEVVEEADRWLRGVGHPEWRASLLVCKAGILGCLGEYEEAVQVAEEAYASYRDAEQGWVFESFCCAMGDALFKAGRPGEAMEYFEKCASPTLYADFYRYRGLEGLAKCQAEIRDYPAARRTAASALRYAEQLTDDCVADALSTNVKVMRAVAAYDQAWAMALREMEAASRCALARREYRAFRDVVDVALDRGDLDAARHYLPALSRAADMEDKPTGRLRHAAEVEERRRRLAELEASAEAGP